MKKVPNQNLSFREVSKTLVWNILRFLPSLLIDMVLCIRELRSLESYEP